MTDAGNASDVDDGETFGVEARWDGSSVVVTVRGEVDAATCEGLRAALLDVTERGAAQVAIDLHDVSFIDSSGLGVIVGAVKRLGGTPAYDAPDDGSRCPLRVVGLQPSIRRVFELTGLGPLCEPGRGSALSES